MRFAVLLWLLLTTSFSACGPCGSAVQFHVDVYNRSGSLDDDYVEEPISKSSSKYAHALEVSNEIVESLRDGKTHEVYERWFGEALRQSASEAQFAEALRGLEDFGPVREFRPMQWSFASRLEMGKPVLYSTKIVEHVKGRIGYVCVFEDDGKYQTLLGFHWRHYTGVHTPGQL